MSDTEKKVPLVQRIITYSLLVLVGCSMLLPFAWMIRSSLCDNRTVIKPLEKLSDFIPEQLHPENYLKVFDAIPFFTYLLNTVIITGSVIIGSVLSSSLCAYAFAFCKVPYRKKVFYAVLATIMLPPVVTMIPRFILFREIGWIDTFKPLIIPAFCGNAFAIFLFRQFFLGVPSSLIEAARIDGATNLQIWYRIIMPLSKPVIITVAIFSFMGAWNNFMGPLIYLNSKENWTLQLGLNSFKGEAGGQWNLLMACTVLVLLPVIIVFFSLQRYFIRGISTTGLKG